MRITFIIPCRNNLPYLKQAINSIHEHYGESHDIIILDDASSDGTYDWVKYSLIDGDKNNHITFFHNESGKRIGHTVLYDIGIQLASTPIITILHSDMVVTKNYVSNILSHIKPGVVVSGTRIEPPLHPPGPEKLIMNFGLEPDEFELNRESFDKFVFEQEAIFANKTTNGIFAPWTMYKDDFSSIGGHDALFAPMELEDSDIFNRFVLAGFTLLQARDAFVYHMTCRGSRFKDGIVIEQEIPLPDGTIWYKPKDSEEYIKLRNIKLREWYRKWHSGVLHDDMMMPIVPEVYTTKIEVIGCTDRLLQILEPWCDRIFVDCDYETYIRQESRNTMFDLNSRIFPLSQSKDYEAEVTLRLDTTEGNNSDGKFIPSDDFMDVVSNIAAIIEAYEITRGEFSVSDFTLKVNISPDFSMEKMIQPVIRNVF